MIKKIPTLKGPSKGLQQGEGWEPHWPRFHRSLFQFDSNFHTVGSDFWGAEGEFCWEES